MPRSERFLYASFLRLLRRARAERLPLTGVAGMDVISEAPLDVLRRLFRQQSGLNVERGLRLLSVLQAQLDVLASCEEETREALAEWEQLIAEQAAAPPSAAAAAAALAAERGTELLARQSGRLAQLFSPILEEVQQAAENVEADVDDRQPAPTLDSLAAEVQLRSAELLAAAGGGAGLPRAAVQAQESLVKAQALSEVLYSRHRYCYRPFEWVYDGLRPLLLPDVLERRRGTPLTLAVLAAGVGRRVGLPLVPLPGDGSGGPLTGGVESGGRPEALLGQSAAALDQLPPQLAAKLTTAGQEVLPLQPPWLLLVQPAGAAAGGAGGAVLGGGAGSPCTEDGHGRCYMDAATGLLLGPEEAGSKYPAANLAADWVRQSPMAVWRALVRTIIQAHQRRGESDLVAHWTYVLLALDPGAAEWAYMLRQGAT